MENFAHKVSVVVPFCNAEKFIFDAVSSILKQSLIDFELLAVDDGSTDRTSAIIEGFGDSRIKLLTLGNNKGNYFARNHGMSVAQGEYICVLDADDIARSDRLAKQVDFLDEFSSIGVIVSNYIIINEHGKEISKRILPSTPSKLNVILLRNNFILHSSLMFRSKIVHEYGYYYDETLPYSADYDFLSRLANLFKIACLPEFLSFYRCHPNQISKTKATLQRNIADNIRKKQFIKWGILDNSNLAILNRFMTDEPLYKWEVELVIKLLHKILQKDIKTQVFDHEYFIEYFQKCCDSIKLI